MTKENTNVNRMLLEVAVDWIKANWKKEDGQTMAEYGVILALIAVVVIGTLTVLGTSIKDKVQGVVDGLK